jgi:TMEM175 potassium channel family protein
MTAPKPRYARTSTELEFDRVAFFSDAVFAIAMTLLVVGIGVPTVAADGLDDALRDKQSEIISFVISFVVIGYYWLSHHRFFARLNAVTTTLMKLNLVYLLAIAFTPFPTALAGKYTDEPVSVVMYAITLGIASGMEVAMLRVAHRQQLTSVILPEPVVRWATGAALIPVIIFVISIPIAFANTVVALLTWLLVFPLELIWDRLARPEGAEELAG